MFYLASPTTFRPALLACAAILTAVLSTPAMAIDGRSAVGVCIDSSAGGARCVWSVNDKGEINICNKSGCVYCKSATDECQVAAKGRPRPNRTLPVGAKVIVPLLGVVTTPKPFTGSILGFRCAEGERLCPGHGCISTHTQCDPLQ